MHHDFGTECYLWGKATSAQGLQTYHFLVPIFLKPGSINLLEPSGSVQGLRYIFSYMYIHNAVICNIYAYTVGTINNILITFALLLGFRRIGKVPLRHVRPSSVRPSAFNSAAPIERIFVNFDIEDL